MSIQTQIDRIKSNIAAVLSVLSAEGVTVGAKANSNTLAELVLELAYSNIDCGMFGETDIATEIDGGDFGEADTEVDLDCGTF